MLKTEQEVNKIIEALEDNKAHRIVKIDLRKIEKSPASVGRKFFIIIIWDIYHPNSSYFPLFIHHST